MIPILYMSKANRDAAWKQRGGKRSSTRNQLIHPQYIADYEQVTGTHLTAADCGFGNTIYKTHFPVLYSLEASR